jgi:opacity protein-like surface antigen
MRKIYLVILGLATSGMYTYGQGLTQSADGKSTIPLRGAAIGIDLAKTELSFGINNINSAVKESKVKMIFGGNVKVKNEDGIGNLFSSGDIVSGGSVNAFAGFTFSNAFNAGEAEAYTVRLKLTADYNERLKSYRDILRKDLSAYFNAVAQQELVDADRTATTTSLQSILDSILQAETFYDAIKGLTDPNEKIQTVYQRVTDYAKSKKNDFLEDRTQYINKLSMLNADYRKTNNQRFTIFAFGTIETTNFKKFNTLDTTNFGKSFKDINDKGNHIGIGVNYQVGSVWLGVAYSYVLTNNFSDLVKKDYTIKNVTNTASGSLIQEKTITGDAGTYGTLHVNNLDADVVIRIGLDKARKNIMLINPYLRGIVFSRDQSLLANKTNLGTGFYFLQGKFLGGFYVELPDVANNLEKNKPFADQNFKPAYKRLTFGVVTKFNFSSIMGW